MERLDSFLVDRFLIVDYLIEDSLRFLCFFFFFIFMGVWWAEGYVMFDKSKYFYYGEVMALLRSNSVTYINFTALFSIDV